MLCPRVYFSENTSRSLLDNLMFLLVYYLNKNGLYSVEALRTLLVVSCLVMANNFRGDSLRSSHELKRHGPGPLKKYLFYFLTCSHFGPGLF